MKDQLPLIVIGLATYKRPMMLKKALDSLIEIEIPSGTVTKLVLCENSDSTKSRKLLEEIREDLRIASLYVQETKKGIVHARNRMLGEATKQGADYLAFFDDDEQVSKSWLVQLYDSLIANEAQVIQGKVESVFPEGESLGDYKEEYPSSPRVKNGRLLKVAYTNNVIVDLAFLNSKRLRFDQRLNDSGGSDALLFKQLHRAGAKIVYCDDAVVKETIPESRSNLNWLEKRKYRDGFAGILTDKILENRGKYWVKVVVHLLTFSKYTFLRKMRLSGNKQVSHRFYQLEALGAVHAAFKRKIDYYGKVDGE